MTGLSELLGAVALVALGGVFAAMDAAISTVSPARVQPVKSLVSKPPFTTRFWPTCRIKI